MGTTTADGGTQTEPFMDIGVFLVRHSHEGENLLQRTVTDDEARVHLYEPRSK